MLVFLACQKLGDMEWYNYVGQDYCGTFYGFLGEWKEANEKNDNTESLNEPFVDRWIKSAISKLKLNVDDAVEVEGEMIGFGLLGMLMENS